MNGEDLFGNHDDQVAFTDIAGERSDVAEDGLYVTVFTTTHWTTFTTFTTWTHTITHTTTFPTTTSPISLNF